jgi:hypothetical protein
MVWRCSGCHRERAVDMVRLHLGTSTKRVKKYEFYLCGRCAWEALELECFLDLELGISGRAGLLAPG